MEQPPVEQLMGPNLSHITQHMNPHGAQSPVMHLYTPPCEDSSPARQSLFGKAGHLLSEIWFQMGFSVVYVVVAALDLAGVMMLMMLVVLMTLALFGLLLRELVVLAAGVDRKRSHSAVALAMLSAALPAASLGGVVLMKMRFHLHEERYEAVARGVVEGSYPKQLQPEDAALGAWVDAHPDGSVSFMTVTHGFAGHNGFLRTVDCQPPTAAPPGGWTYYGAQLADCWYVVGN